MTNYRILRYDTLDSTNNKAKECIESLSHKDVIVAMEQTAGKGRRGRSWLSRKGDDLMMSLVLKPSVAVTDISAITLVMALAVSEGLINLRRGLLNERKVAMAAECDLQNENDIGDAYPLPQIKWPNDVVISSRKVCGILTESSFLDEGVSYIIIGCGINVGSEEFHFSIENMAGSLKTIWGIKVTVDEVLKEVLEAFDKYYEVFEREGFGTLEGIYNERLISLGREVLIDKDKGACTGICRGVNSRGELIVDFDGRIKEICAGEVSVRGLYGYV